MGAVSDPRLLTLHAVRVAGLADDGQVSRRYGLDRAEVTEHLLDFEAYGWVTHTDLLDITGWSLTDRGRAENERQLAQELAVTGGAGAVRAAYREFLLHNPRLLRACTDWQLRPVVGDPVATNDHTDWAWDERVLRTLRELHGRLQPLVSGLREVLERFTGYDRRFGAALERVDRGDPAAVDQPRADSCHTVWFELHEDLLATLGMRRGQELDTENPSAHHRGAP